MYYLYIMETIRNKNHVNGKSNDMILMSIKDKYETIRKVKLTYSCGNNYENCDIKLFDGNNFNCLFTKDDLTPNPSRVNPYILSNGEREDRANTFFNELIKLVIELLN